MVGAGEAAQPVEQPAAASLSARRAFVNFLSLAGARLAGTLLEFFALVVVARAWGPAAFGAIAFGRTAVNYFGILADPGLSMVGMRSVARSAAGPPNIGGVVILKAVLTGVSLCVMAAFAGWLAPRDVRPVVFGYLALLVPFGLSLEWLFKGLERMRLVAFVRIARGGAFLLATLAVVGLGAETPWVAIGEGISWWVAVGTLYWCARPSLMGDGGRFTLRGARALLAGALPIGLSWFLTTAYQLSAVIFVGFLAGAEQAGFYGAAQRAAVFLHGFGVLLGESLVAPFVRLSGDKSAQGRLASAVASLTLVLMVPLAVSMTFDGATVAQVVYGGSFGPSGPILALLMGQVLLILLNIPLYVTLIARNQEGQYLRAIALGAVASVVLNLALVPRFGAVGAGAAALTSEAAVLISLFVRSRSELALERSSSLVFVALLAAAGTAIVGVLGPGPSVWRALLGMGAGWLLGGFAVRRSIATLVSTHAS